MNGFEMTVMSTAFTVFGVVAIAVGMRAWLRNLRYRTRGVVVPGQVVGFERRVIRRRGRTRTLFEPVVTYQDPQGQWLQVKASWATSRPWQRPGDSVRVTYLPDTPQRFRLDGAPHGRLATMLIVVGLVQITVATLVALISQG